LEDTGGLEEIHGISEVAVSEVGDEFERVPRYYSPLRNGVRG